MKINYMRWHHEQDWKNHGTQEFVEKQLTGMGNYAQKCRCTNLPGNFMNNAF